MLDNLDWRLMAYRHSQNYGQNGEYYGKNKRLGQVALNHFDTEFYQSLEHFIASVKNVHLFTRHDKEFIFPKNTAQIFYFLIYNKFQKQLSSICHAKINIFGIILT